MENNNMAPMEQKPMPAPAQSMPPQSDEPKTGVLYTGKAPVAVQIVGGLMWLHGLALIIIGVPLLLVFGLGVLFIVLGVFVIKYARLVFKMQKKGYVGAMVIQGISLVLSVISLGGLHQGGARGGGSIIVSLIIMGVLYMYRGQFVDSPKM